MNKSVSRYLGFTEQEIIEIIREEKLKVPENSNVLEELKRQHEIVISS